MVFKHYIRIVFAACFVVFILNKFTLRPWLAWNHHKSGILHTFSYSLPNFLEAIMGTLLIAGILFFFRERQPKTRLQPADSALYLTATLLAAMYVLSQEFGLHSIGGNNVFDPIDVVASILGLVCVNSMLFRFGLIATKNHKRQ